MGFGYEVLFTKQKGTGKFNSNKHLTLIKTIALKQ